MRIHRRSALRATVIAAVITVGASACATSGGGSEPAAVRPFDELGPSDFVAAVDNPYFPRIPGMTWAYEGMTDEGLRRTETEVLTETFEILGVDATVVSNRDYLDGELTEDNLDYFAQDRDGNVWYLGEEVANYEKGVLHDHGGSWLAGDDGNIPGIVMLADPTERIGETYLQEHLLDSPRDQAEVISVSERVDVPAGSFDGVLQTHDTSAVELDLDEHKFYATGVGLVRTIDLTTGDEFLLIAYSRS